MTHKDKEEAIAALEELKGDCTGVIAATIEDCQRVIGEMPEDDRLVPAAENCDKAGRRLIDANEIIKVAEHAHEQWNLAMVGADDTRKVNEVFKKQYLCKVVKAVAESCKTVDAAKVVHGEWMLRHEGRGHYWECSVCHTNPCIYVTKDTNYCPNCGAKMRTTDA